MSRYYAGSGPTSSRRQAAEAYRQLRRSLVEYAAVEAEIDARRHDNLNEVEEAILRSRRTKWAERIQVFAAVYHVERTRCADDARDARD